MFLLGARSELSPDASQNLDRVSSLGVRVDEILEENALPQVDKGLEGADLAIDAIFGTGFKGVPRGVAAGAIEILNEARVPIVSIDIPSGLDATTGRAEGMCVRANATYTMGLLKRGLTLYPGRELAGIVEVLDIGIPESVVDAMALRIEALDREWAKVRLPTRRPDVHKGDCGHVLVVGGSTGLSGAVALASRAAMRAGAGLVTALVPRSLNAVLEIKLTEPMTRPMDETAQGSLAATAEKAIVEWLGKCDVVALGPGVSRVPETAALVRRIVAASPIPVVLDADGLNAFEALGDELARAGAPLVITPHAGEMSRLFGIAASELDKDRIGTAIAAASRFRCVVVYKGAPTVIAAPDGRTYLNPTGNAGMATGGTGDVLTGMIAGLIGQGCAPFEGAALAAYLHGLAGDFAVRQLGVWGLLAGDLIEALPDAMLAVWKDEDTESDDDDDDSEEEV